MTKTVRGLLVTAIVLLLAGGIVLIGSGLGDQVYVENTSAAVAQAHAGGGKIALGILLLVTASVAGWASRDREAPQDPTTPSRSRTQA